MEGYFMVKNDIYDNEGKYLRFVQNINECCNPPTAGSKRKYWIKNPINVKYFKKLFDRFDARDISFIRRLRLCRTFMMVNHILEMDLKDAEREDIDKAVAYSHKVNKSVKSKRDFALDLKFLWKQLFPEEDEKGRIDDTLFPYSVRHLNGRVDKSHETLRGDKFSIAEFERLVQGFADDPRMQCLLTICLESLARPQEILFRRIKDVELYENYAKIYISSHGKEGTGFLRIIDSYFYLTQWLNKHPLKKDKNAFLFVNTGRLNRFKQMTPFGSNKLLRDRCKKLGINKPITLYSLKRNGITIMRLQGKSDLEIQHTARWTSTKQLKTYDMSTQEESFRKELINRGILKASGHDQEAQLNTKKCIFCSTINGIAESICSNCKRSLDKEDIIRQEMQKEKENLELKNKLTLIEKMFEENRKKSEFIEKIIKGLATKGKINDAIDLVHEQKLEKELIKLIGKTV